MTAVRVLPDETGLGKAFDYAVPDDWHEPVVVGTRVRVALGPRRVGGWVVATDVVPPPDVELRALAKHSGTGPAPDLVELARWAAWRWAARTPVPFLRTASPPRIVGSLPRPGGLTTAGTTTGGEPTAAVGSDPVARAFAADVAVLRLAPASDRWPVVRAAVARGPAVIVCPTHREADVLAGRLRRDGVPVARHPDDWAAAAAGGRVVVGTRAAAWAPAPDAASFVLLDEHDEVHQEEGSPTWHARDVLVERSRRAGVPCVLVSPMPTLEAQAAGTLVVPDRATERSGWPSAVLVDRREDDAARNALFSPALADVVRSGASVVCVLNRTGRAALLACAACHELARCRECDGAMRRPDQGALECRRCGATRPEVCIACGGFHLKTVRLGVSRVAEDLAALAQEPVTEVTGSGVAGPPDGRLHVGTEAVLHHVRRADVVAFLDLDQELLAPRYRAGEQALGLLVRASRIVRGRRDGGRILVQTRMPEHEVCRAAVAGDPAIVGDADRERRELFRQPPFVALAEIGDQAGEAFAAAVPRDGGVVVRGPVDGKWLVEAPDHDTLCDALAATPRPPGRLRLAVDPPRI